MSTPAYRRILLKLSGEALMGDDPYGINEKVVERIVGEIAEVSGLGVQIGIVIGGGNIFRGIQGAASGMDRATADYIGMLATVMNAMALSDAFRRHEVESRVLSALRIEQVVDPYIRARAIRHLEEGRIVIFAAGTGNPFFTTDTAAALRGAEIGAQIVLKATKVDGVYDADPKKVPGAKRFDELTYDEVISRDLQVMDTAAFALCRDSNLPLRIFDMSQPGVLLRILNGEPIGTLVRGRG